MALETDDTNLPFAPNVLNCHSCLGRGGSGCCKGLRRRPPCTQRGFPRSSAQATVTAGPVSPRTGHCQRLRQHFQFCPETAALLAVSRCPAPQRPFPGEHGYLSAAEGREHAHTGSITLQEPLGMCPAGFQCDLGVLRAQACHWRPGAETLWSLLGPVLSGSEPPHACAWSSAGCGLRTRSLWLRASLSIRGRGRGLWSQSAFQFPLKCSSSSRSRSRARSK